MAVLESVAVNAEVLQAAMATFVGVDLQTLHVLTGHLETMSVIYPVEKPAIYLSETFNGYPRCRVVNA